MSEEWVLFFLYFEKGSLIVPSQSLRGALKAFKEKKKSTGFLRGKGGGKLIVMIQWVQMGR